MPTLRTHHFSQGDWMSAPEWVSVKEAAELSGYSPQYVRRIMRQGKVKAGKMGGIQEWLIDEQSLREYVKAMKSLGTDKHNPHRNGD
jgi:excisionase family DNA binding protein